MSFAKVSSAQTSLLKAHPVLIEVDISRGLHSFSVVGLPDKAVEESRDRISAAIKNSGYKSPKAKNEKVVISLAPADIKKEGPIFDLGMAIGYLVASGDVKADIESTLFLGELSLDGSLRPIKGTLPIVHMAKTEKYKTVFVPKDNAKEASLVGDIEIFGASSLQDVIHHLEGSAPIEAVTSFEESFINTHHTAHHDMQDVHGQEHAKRGLEIAASGGHNVALYGPPGTGKSMLAKAFSGILPPLDFEDALEVTSIHSIAGILKEHIISHPPFRSPHHTSSYVAIIGGGAHPRPGEVTLAHKGVLFLDEFPEFDRRVVESLRQPLEDRIVAIARAKGSATFPAQFLLIAAMNPCPCGNFGFKGKPCTCGPHEIQKYKKKLSGPLVERIDIWLTVERIPHNALSEENIHGETSEMMRKRVIRAREIQKKRLSHIQKKTNAEMSAKDIALLLKVTESAKQTMNNSAEKLGLSPRVYHKVLKIARTIADLEQSEKIETAHILEALQYRPREQQ